MIIYISSYTAHLNQLLYSALEFSKVHKHRLIIKYDNSIKENCALIEFNNNSYFLDYSDNYVFSDLHTQYDYYLKRSLRQEDYKGNIKPLNFQINFATSPFVLFNKLPKNKEFLVKSKIEILRMLDVFKLTNMSHYSMLYDVFVKAQNNKGDGKIIFYTRLWDPDNNKNPDEKKRREKQNDFRIGACRIIKDNFKNSKVGVFDSKLARAVCPDLIFPNKIISKKEYFSELSNSSICIADDGLKDTPGWKIGEYALMGKSIISTPINVLIKDFIQDLNYLELTDRNSYEEIPDKVEYFLSNNNYLRMSEQNVFWSEKYLHPSTYISNIIDG